MFDIRRYYQASDVKDAVAALVRDPEAVVINGGTDVLIKIREGRMAGCSLVGIHGLKELEGVSLEEGETLCIRPGTSFSQIVGDPLVRERVPVLGRAADQVGGPQIRNMGTIGGNLCNGVTSADTASTLLALNAWLELTGPSGVRRVKVSEFYLGPGRTAREHAELLTAIRICREDYEGYGGAYLKYGKRNAMEIATLGCAALVKLTPDRARVEDLRLAFGVAAPTPMRCAMTEESAKGMALGEGLLERVSAGARSEIHPRSSWRASKEFRMHLAGELAGRAVRQAVIDAGGEMDA